jgi:hypothetical protein
VINIDNETILSLEDAAIYFSKLSGRSRNREVVRRWINRGCNGIDSEEEVVPNEFDWPVKM